MRAYINRVPSQSFFPPCHPPPSTSFSAPWAQLSCGTNGVLYRGIKFRNKRKSDATIKNDKKHIFKFIYIRIYIPIKPSTYKEGTRRRFPFSPFCSPLACHCRLRSLSARAAARRSLAHHHLDELLVVDLAIAVHVGLADHFVHLLVRQLLAEVRHDVAQLGGGDEAVAVLVKHAERLLDLLLRVRVLHLAGHQRQELGEVNGAAAVLVHLVDHVLQLRLRRVLAQRAHHRAELLRRDGAIAVLVEQREGLLELGDLLIGQLISHFKSKPWWW
ncbi:hypothetical protein TCSYLVIO_006561 [Trypanosoma cruzi]|nr:hypothetical protein TCSYLVIO_006561 [Trypanosoma cruzi]